MSSHPQNRLQPHLPSNPRQGSLRRLLSSPQQSSHRPHRSPNHRHRPRRPHRSPNPGQGSLRRHRSSSPHKRSRGPHRSPNPRQSSHRPHRSPSRPRRTRRCPRSSTRLRSRRLFLHQRPPLNQRLRPPGRPTQSRHRPSLDEAAGSAGPSAARTPHRRMAPPTHPRRCRRRPRCQHPGPSTSTRANSSVPSPCRASTRPTSRRWRYRWCPAPSRPRPSHHRSPSRLPSPSPPNPLTICSLGRNPPARLRHRVRPVRHERRPASPRTTLTTTNRPGTHPRTRPTSKPRPVRFLAWDGPSAIALPEPKPRQDLRQTAGPANLVRPGCPRSAWPSAEAPWPWSW